MTSRASVALEAVIARVGSERAVARLLGCNHSAVNHWRRGNRIPGRKFAGLMELTWQIRASWWDEPAKRAA